jgi:LemA protein
MLGAAEPAGHWPMTTLLLSTLAVIALAMVLVFNTLIRRRNAAENAYAGIDVYLTMRYDLIPNLVETVKGYAQHERETLHAITAARAEAIAGDLPSNRRVLLDNRIGESMRRLFALAEAYPDLKASENFQQLQRALNEVEERLSAARRAFNASVLDYNNAIDQFPTNLVAMTMGFQRRAFLDAPDQVRQAPRVGAQLANGARDA